MRAIWCGVLVALSSCDAGAPSCKDAFAKGGARVSHDPAALTQVCEAKHWSGGVRSCVSRAASNDEAGACLKPVAIDLTELEMREAEAAARKAEAEAQAAKATIDALGQQLAELQRQVDDATDRLHAEIDDMHGMPSERREKLRLEVVELTAKLAAAQKVASSPAPSDSSAR